jgi:predicted GNAT superfamily acetyltransferase
MGRKEIKIEECRSLESLKECVRLQREVFSLPEIELSPVRHFIVTNNAGGFTLGAFYKNELVGFCLSVPAVLYDEKAYYSHMTAVDANFQGLGIGARLKWKQREIAIEKGVQYIKWTFQPVMARNAFFNLEKLGVLVRKYKPNFYGTDYATSAGRDKQTGLDSDRLICEWHLQSKKVLALAKGDSFDEERKVVGFVETVNNWTELVKTDPPKAIERQNQIKKGFQKQFSEGLICRGFERNEISPNFLFYKD